MNLLVHLIGRHYQRRTCGWLYRSKCLYHFTLRNTVFSLKPCPLYSRTLLSAGWVYTNSRSGRNWGILKSVHLSRIEPRFFCDPGNIVLAPIIVSFGLNAKYYISLEFVSSIVQHKERQIATTVCLNFMNSVLKIRWDRNENVLLNNCGMIIRKFITANIKLGSLWAKSWASSFLLLCPPSSRNAFINASYLTTQFCKNFFPQNSVCIFVPFNLAVCSFVPSLSTSGHLYPSFCDMTLLPCPAPPGS